jgi:hypothetical protein
MSTSAARPEAHRQMEGGGLRGRAVIVFDRG